MQFFYTRSCTQKESTSKVISDVTYHVIIINSMLLSIVNNVPTRELLAAETKSSSGNLSQKEEQC